MKSQYFSSEVLEKFKKNRKGMLGLYMLITAIIVATLAPFLVLHNPLSYFSENEYVNHPPTRGFPLGTDVLGRDVYSQIVWGFRSALIISIPSALLVGLIGTVVGLASGYYGGVVDAILQRISITFLVWPSIPFVALIVYSWGAYQAQLAIILAVAFTLWPTSARAIRAEVSSLKSRAFVEAAKVSGAESKRIIFRHILPNVLHLTFLYVTIAVASALTLDATINFLGLGNPSVVTWGQMLTFTLATHVGYAAWWTVLPPGLAITYMVLSPLLVSIGWRESTGRTFVRP